MPDTETARLIFSAALRDYQAVKNMLDSRAFPEEIFGFHAQQAVEKTLKAWLVLLNQKCPRTHNIRQLLVLLEQVGSNIDPFWDFVELTAFAVQFRYEAYETLDNSINRATLVAEIGQLICQVEDLLNLHFSPDRIS